MSNEFDDEYVYRCCTCEGAGLDSDGHSCRDCDGTGLDNHPA